MNRIIIITGLAFVGLASAAHAGPCTDRIASIEKSMSMKDAGSGPTQAPGTGGSQPNAGVPKAGEAPGTGGTAGMNATVGDKAASPADVRAQTSGQPTAAQGGGSVSAEVSNALASAKKADAAGDATACGRSLDEAERLLHS
ncbi:type IV secretory pathway TrbL component [Ancylobacter sp. 3268]|uniref:hypothetical protein n=1 Tax=Ancylobacter sp. 3268 TaxID=2817752 RepID=UPI00285D10F6|nr:hypothetical protein [Ancylobacter sp. 3268]MDR6954895.1 type IV secretory pathway TrbL component [Ancylobacter sp. 3268]